MDFNWVEWFGYLASLVVLISLTMTSIFRLRIINFIGCLLFATFAYLIDSYPTMFMNLGIAGINVYYLWKIYSSKERFKLIAASVQSEYFDYFIEENRDEIETQTSLEELKKADMAFYMLRNNSLAGILVGNTREEGTLDLVLDYVTPEYRDFKLANYFYESHPQVMQDRGVNRLIAHARTQEHKDYLKKVGFREDENEEGAYYKQL